ncbi:MAG: ATP-binding protein, partial [Bacteriovoracaceae bacterium]|nr:ATP-binding protein [Bacteriovoracaceae bacterium]
MPPQTKENITDLSALEAEIYLHLQSLIGEEKFKSFFQNHLILKNIENQIEFLATSSLIKKMIETCYFNALSLSIEQTFGEKVPFFISLLGSTAPAIALPEVEYKITQKSKSVKDFRFCLEDKPQNTQQKLNLNPSWDASKTFENFIFDEENHLLYSACLSVAQNPKRMYPLLFLHGNSGLGKTHLLNAMAYKITQMHPHLKVLLISGRDFMNEMVENIKTQTILDFRKKYTSADVLLFDDLHDLQNKKGTLSEFYYLLDDFFQKKKQMVIASYHAPKNMHGLDERIQSRICSALILDIKIPNLEIRKSILKQKAVEQDLHLNEDVVELIARSFQVNIGQLEGALIRLSAYASLFKTNIDLELAKNQLGLNLTPLKKTSLGSITT